MKLNLGCGPHPAPGWVNVDRQAQWHPDVVADMTSLPYDDGSAEQVYCGHVLEHLRYEDELPAALAEIRRVLQPEGVLLVVGPCLDKATAGGWDAEIIRRIWPGDRHAEPGASHQWPSTEALTAKALHAADFTSKPVGLVSPGWPIVSAVAWQFALRARSA